MAQCVYPSCKVEIASGGDNPPLWCEAHQNQKCVLPSCQEHVIPNSGWCKQHNDWVAMFDFIHPIRHAEAAQRRAEAQRTQQLLQKGMMGGNGRRV